MSRFYYSYPGNKRVELHHIDAVIEWDQFDKIVEPFAGSAALSLELHARGLNKSYILNDRDPHHIAMLKYVAEHTSAPLYEYCLERRTPEEFARHHGLKEPTTTFEHFYRQRVRGDFSRAQKPPTKWPTYTRGPRQIAADACINDAIITHKDWMDCVDSYKDDPRALIFLDPPYFNSFNQSYYGMDGVKCDPDGHIRDGTALFIEMLEYLETAAATIVVITNSCAIIDHIMAPFIRHRYAKRYASCIKRDGAYVKKATDHILLVGGGRTSAPRSMAHEDAEASQ